MTRHVVSYDLSQPERNYAKVIDAIKSFPGWCHALESVWIIQSDLSAEDIRNRLKTALDADDKLMVAAMGGAWATYNVGSEQTNWLYKAA